MEAGVGTLTRMDEGSLDLALLVAEPSPKSIEVAGRAAQIIAELGIRRMQVFGAPKRLHALDGFGLEITDYLVPEDDSTS